MPNNNHLLQELMKTFRQEAVEHLETLNRALLQYERASTTADRQAQIQDGFRAAHSLKGAARAVSLDDLQTVAHAVESVFQQVRDADKTLAPSDCDTLYDTLDTLARMLNEETVDTAPILARLRAMVETPTDNETPQPEPETVVEPDKPMPTVLAESDKTIRVPLNKLDDLMAEVGELLVARISTAHRLSETRELNRVLTAWSKSWASLKPVLQRQDDPQLTDMMLTHADTMHQVIERFQYLEGHTQQDVTRLDMVTDTLQNKVRRVRMIPFSVHRLALERVVRDAARVSGKAVKFEIVGAEIELDKRVLEGLKSPLVHLLRNAVGHGIESPGERGNKPETGRVALRVWQRGSEVHISVTDDGRGFQLEAIQQAYQQQYSNAEMDNPLQMAFLPGVTTADEVNEIAGRGVGLDVVREQLKQVHGRFNVQTAPSMGTTINLIVPTSLAITRMLLVQVGAARYALPLVAIEKIVIPDNIAYVANKPMLRVDDHNMPLASLRALLGNAQTDEKEGGQQLAIVMNVGDQRLSLLVDDVLTEQELAVKPIGYPVVSLQNITGAALLGTGEPVIVLNPADFMTSYRRLHQPVLFKKQEPTVPEQVQKVRVLVVDDSITTRTLEQNILKAAGFEVMTATNGVEALAQLDRQTVDIVVSDIEMPQMDGFELTNSIREHDTYSHLPIILVTSLERESDKERGMLAGANAYIVKRGFDQAELLNTIDQLV